MIEEFSKIHQYLLNKDMQLRNHAANEVIQDYNFFLISEQVRFEQKEEEIKYIKT